MKVSEITAKRILRDMKKEYRPKSGRLTIDHLNDYFNIPNTMPKGIN